jgi:hypothetical protein
MALNDPRPSHPDKFIFSEPAFPSAYGTTNGNDGLTMRDYFAGQALIAAYASWMADCRDANSSSEFMAEECYLIADAMIAARSGHGRPTGEA